MSIDLEADIRFPARADDWVETLVVGTLLTLFSVLLLPLVPIYGYLLHTARAAMAGAEEPLSFTDWETLFVDGLKGTVVVFVYQLPPLLVGLLSFVALLGLGSGSDALAGLSLLVFLLGLLAAMLLGLLFGYLGLVAVLSFASEDELGAAFDPGLLKAVALDRDFAIQWLYGIGLIFAANVVFGVALFMLNLVMIIPIIGLIIAMLALIVVGPAGAAVMFYVQIAVFRVWGRGYGDSRDLAPADVPDWIGRRSNGPTEAADESGYNAPPSEDPLE